MVKLNKEEKKSKILTNLFKNIIISMILVEFANEGCGFVDGIMVSRFLGADAIAAQGIAYPYFSLLGIFSGMLVTGMQSLCTSYIGAGKKEELNSVFSITCLIGGLFSILISMAIFLFPGIISSALGKLSGNSALIDLVQQYLKGVAIGTPGLLFVAIFSPLVHIDGDQICARCAVMSIFISDVIGDYLAGVLHAGIFGMGLATSISNYIGMAVLMMHFLRKSCSFHFTLRFHFECNVIRTIFGKGLPKATKRIANTIRPIILNGLTLSIGASTAMAALSVRNNLNNIMDIFGSGLVSATLLMVSILYEEQNVTGLRQITRQAVRYIFVGIGFITLIIFAAAPILARFYIKDDPQVCSMAATAIRFMAINLPINALNEVYVSFLQGTGRYRGVNILNFCSRFVYIVACAFIMSKVWGVNGIWAAFPVSSILLFATIVIFCLIKNRTYRPSAEIIFSLPDDFGNLKENTFECTITTMDEVCETAERTGNFCREHGIDNRRAYLTDLCILEMAGNIVQHGFPLNKKKHSVDIRVTISDNKELTLRVRDDCPLFDVKARGELWRKKEEDPGSCIGIRLVMSISSNLVYITTLGTNNLIVTI
ncbi:MAG: MATE family efflux transporter [Clostridia bacterium]|nr:MATE family efflux transporter [Clostridia bacterium]